MRVHELPRASELERRFLQDAFAELCRIESPSGQERHCAERVSAELRSLGIEVQEDRAGALVGSQCGNLLARIDPWSPVPATQPPPGSSCPSVLLCAHLDTAPPQAPVAPVLSEGAWQNANEGALGADNKLAVAVLLALARHLARHGAPAAVEMLFMVSHQAPLAGAASFQASSLQSEFGYVFDHGSPIGEVILGGPSQYRLQADFLPSDPENGMLARRPGGAPLAAARAASSMRSDHPQVQSGLELTTPGTAEHVGPASERCSVSAEVRSESDGGAEALLADLISRVHTAANLPECACNVEISVQRTSAPYRLRASRRAVGAAEAALCACGHEPVRVPSGESSLASALLEKGLEAVNLANGAERINQPGERVEQATLDGMLEVAIALVDEVAARSAEPSL